jgi:chemotaxis protein histidine kinase CheA
MAKSQLVLPSSSFGIYQDVQLAQAAVASLNSTLAAEGAALAQSASDARKSADALAKEAAKLKTSEAIAAAKSAAEAARVAEANAAKAAAASAGDRWKGYSTGISLASFLSNDTMQGRMVRKTVNGLSDLVTVMEVSVTILKTIGTIINAFQSDINNLMVVLNFAIKAMIKVLEELAVSLASTGIYGLLVTPSISPFSPDSPSGGFKEFKAKVNNALTNKSDPNRPVFFEGDIMGGVVVALVGATNIGDLLKDLQVLAKFFQDESVKLAPVRSLVATPGLFYKSEEKGVVGTTLGYLQAMTTGAKYPGIKISWSEAEGIPIDGYRIRRSKSAKGDFPEKDVTVPKDSLINPGMPLREYKDVLFNNDTPLDLTGFGDNTSYVDFEVQDGETYYYKVSPLLKNKDGDFVEDPTIGGYTSAVASSCLPDSVADSTYETPKGLLAGVATGDPPYWSNMTLRGLLGESLDSILKSLTDLAKRFEAVTESNTKHFDKLIKTLTRWIKKLTEFLDKLKAVLAALKALQLSGAAMILSIPSEKGGIAGFKKRFNAAKLPEPSNLGKLANNLVSHTSGSVESFAKDNLVPPVNQSTPNPFEENLCSVCAGLVLLVGAPTPASLDKLGGVAKAEMEKIKQAGKFDSTKKAVKAARKKDYTNGKGKGKGDDDTSFADETISFLTGLFAGG